MEKHIADMLAQMARSHEELSRILESTKDITFHTAVQLIGGVPEQNMTFGGKDVVLGNALELVANSTAYLNSIGDLHEALADGLEPVMQQLQEHEEE